MSKPTRILVVGMLTLVIGIVAYTVLRGASLHIVSDPAGATVSVDGQRVGITPLEGFELGAGRHRVEIAHSHYAPLIEQIEVERGEVVDRSVVLQRGMGDLELMSNPKGATVELDGERLEGVAPMRVRRLSGPHKVTMRQPERRSAVAEVLVLAGRTVAVKLDLDIDPHGSLTVTTHPMGALIRLPGTGIEYRPGVRVPIGERLVVVSKRGYRTEEALYAVAYGDNAHHVNLQREYGVLNVSTQPADSQVHVTYPEPERKRIHAGPYEPGMRVPVGPVEIRVQAMGYRTAAEAFEMQAGGHQARIALEPISIAVGTRFRDPLGAGADGSYASGPEMIVVPAGAYLMGAAAGPASERPVRRVTLTQPFAVSVFEVSNAQYLDFVDATQRAADRRANRNAPNEPVGWVDWQSAVAYTAWLSERTGHEYRLPSEAEWEYLARAGSTTPFYFGADAPDICAHANVADLATGRVYSGWSVVPCDDGQARLAPVGSFAANPFGLHDVYGNVSEWVLDCGIPNYVDAPRDGSAADESLDCADHGYRGGSWDSQPEQARSAYRNASSIANDDRGIRLIREL
jgi:formylglycine-generating enzyme required for sulfatase activity